jgi:hypothetical protein
MMEGPRSLFADAAKLAAVRGDASTLLLALPICPWIASGWWKLSSPPGNPSPTRTAGAHEPYAATPPNLFVTRRQALTHLRSRVWLHPITESLPQSRRLLRRAGARCVLTQPKSCGEGHDSAESEGVARPRRNRFATLRSRSPGGTVISVFRICPLVNLAPCDN